MEQQRRVVFFGASVTEQDTHHATGALSGYVTYFQRHLSEGWSVERVSAGSSNITDAGVVYVERVIALAPEICVLDWATPVLADCDPRLVTQVYYRLLQNGILPVTVIFPRKDRDQRAIPLVGYMESLCAEFGLPFYDAAPLVERHGVDTILRDVVHTTPEGARIYAEAMAELLAGVDPATVPAGFARPAPFEVIELTSSKDVPLSFTRMVITNAGPVDEALEVSVVMEQRVGPYSPILDQAIRTGDQVQALPPFAVWDAWCWRERQCIKAITDWYRGPMSSMTLTVSALSPPYDSVPQAEPVAVSDRNLKQRGKAYAILGAGTNARLSYLCDNPKPAAASASAPAPATPARAPKAGAPSASTPSASAPSANAPSNSATSASTPSASASTGPADCVLHIGIGTAGTSLLHRSLQAARDALRDKGVFYPDDILPGGQTGGDNHKCLAIAATEPRTDNIVLRQHQAQTPALRAAFDQRVREHYREAVRQAAGRTCLISAEHFWSCVTRPNEIARLATLMSEAGLRVTRLVVYVQRQSDWFEALQFQRLREGRDLLPMTVDALVTPHLRAQLDYLALINAWQAGFPDAVVLPRLYQNRTATDADDRALIVDFAEATGLALGDIPVQAPGSGPIRLANAGINAILALSTEYPAFLANGRSNPARTEFVAFVAQTLPGNCTLLPEAEKKAIDTIFAESNAALQTRYFADRPALFATESDSVPTEAFQRIDDERFRSSLAALVRTMELSRALRKPA